MAKLSLNNVLKQLLLQDFGAATVSGSDVLNNPCQYFINNYFSEGDYTGFGHINGAYRILPLTLGDNSYLGLDPAANAKVSYLLLHRTNFCCNNSLFKSFGLRCLFNDFWNEWYISIPILHGHTNQWGGDSNPKNLPVVTIINKTLKTTI